MTFTATYSPDDNKLRLYASARLDKETYERVKAAGFKWAPKQELFVAPMWTPEREDLLIELAGEIEDEDKSLVERAEERADRFEDYSDSRAKDADQAHKAVSAIADNIPLGQPILVGHHSERHARKDAERIENGMRKAVKMWNTSQYWTRRAAGAIRHAKYKERPDVRARRIKGLEADKRRCERNVKESEHNIKVWSITPLTREYAIKIAGVDRSYWAWKHKYTSGYEGPISLWDALRPDREEHNGILITPEQAKEKAIKNHRAIIAINERWLEHINHRLEYEKAMLEDQGASKLLEKAPRPELLPLCNYRQEQFILPNRWQRGEMMTYRQIEMTQAEYSKLYHDYKGTRIVENSHRIRTALVKHELVAVFLTDSKVHKKPEPIEAKPAEPRPPVIPIARHAPEPTPEAKKFEALKEQLKEGVKVVVAPQLFPTPPAIAELMVDHALIEPGQTVLEPSAGTGNILRAIWADTQEAEITAVEVSPDLANTLGALCHHIKVGDFLSYNGELGTFDKILMNPPFANGQDIKHIQHAAAMLKPGGRLVAICANGSRQNEILRPLASEWEELPEDTFKEQGTGVRTVLLTINR